MPEGAFNVDAVLGRAVEDPGHREVDQQADCAEGEHDFAVHVVMRIMRSFVGLRDQPPGDQPEGEGIEQGSQDLQAAVPESPLGGGGPSREVEGGQGEADGSGVRHLVCGFRQERQTSGGNAAGELDDHIADGQNERDGQAAPAGAVQIVVMFPGP